MLALPEASHRIEMDRVQVQGATESSTIQVVIFAYFKGKQPGMPAHQAQTNL